jgi:hypothetical protein
MRVGAWQPSTQFTFFANPGAARGAPHRQYLFFGDFHGSSVPVDSATKWSIMTNAPKKHLRFVAHREGRRWKAQFEGLLPSLLRPDVFSPQLVFPSAD